MKSRLHAYIGTTRQLEILLAVHDKKSINEAARSLFLSQPTVSIQMKKLAEAAGAPIYNVVNREFVFTDVGLELVKTAVEVLDSFARLDMKLGKIQDIKSGTLRLSVVTTSKYFIPHLLGPFCEAFPGIEVVLNVGNREQTINRMRQGIDDFYVFSHPPKDFDAEALEFLENPLVAIAHRDHPLAKCEGLSLADIAKEPFLMREQGSGTRFSIESFLQEHKQSLNVKMTIESNEAIKHCVMSKLGISILSAHTLTYGGQSNLVRLPVAELPICSKWFFMWSKTKRSTLVADNFLSHIQSNGRQLLEAELKRNENNDL